MRRRMGKVETERLLSEVLSAVDLEWSERFERRYRPPVSRLILRALGVVGEGIVAAVLTVLGLAAAAIVVILVAPLGSIWVFALFFTLPQIVGSLLGRDGSGGSTSQGRTGTK